MRRVSLVLLALTSLTLAGCDALRDAFSPRANLVARANDQTLTVEQLAGWAGPSKQVPLDPVTLSRVSRYWVEYTLTSPKLGGGQEARVFRRDIVPADSSAKLLTCQGPFGPWQRGSAMVRDGGPEEG